MQPNDYPVDQIVLKRFWESYISSGKVIEQERCRCDPAVVRSWQRCSLRFAPDARPRVMIRDETGLAAIFKTQSQLIEVAIPYLEDIYQFTEGSNSAIMLADGAGCTLALHGDQTMLDNLNELNVGVGSYWAEGYLGTNGLSLAMANTIPAQVVGAEHYFEDFHHLVSSAAPIHHATGRIIGLLGIITTIENATSHTLALVMGAARAISNQLHTNIYVEETNQLISELRGMLEGLPVGVVTWDRHHVINHANYKAEAILEVNRSTIVGKQLWSVIAGPPMIEGAIRDKHPVEDNEFNLMVHERLVNVSASLQPLYDSDYQDYGGMMILRSIEDERQFYYRQGAINTTVHLDQIAAYSPTLQSIMRQARIAARGNSPVLLWGEPGVGKSYLAQAIHNDSLRAHKPFVSVYCSTIPRDLILTELFGYEIQGDTRRQLGKLVLANGGTLFLDHMHDTSLKVQNALLDVIENGTITQLGENWSVPLDVRIIGTSTKDLSALSQAGLFLSDLYFRFGVTNLHIPPLRERTDEIPGLVMHFLNKLSKQMELKKPVKIEDGVLDNLAHYSWPGNIRELECVLESAFFKSYNHVLRVADLPPFVRMGGVLQDSEPQPVLSAAEAEREAIIRAGWACKGRVGKMADMLGLGRTTLWRKMKEMNISAEYFKR